MTNQVLSKSLIISANHCRLKIFGIIFIELLIRVKKTEIDLVHVVVARSIIGRFLVLHLLIEIEIGKVARWCL